MRNIVVCILCLFCSLYANGQDYLKEAVVCFEKGDYECAKKNYTLFQALDGRSMGTQIQLTDECQRIRNLADDYFKDEEYEKARDRYKLVLEKNLQDPIAQKQYDLCVEQLRLQKEQQQKIISPPTTFSVYDEIFQNMVYVEGGTFMMGRNDSDAFDWEKPIHQVTVGSFYMSKYEVTQAQWTAVMGNNPSYFTSDSLPVEQVSWDDVHDFIRKLNTQTGKQYRLPTEAEWEYAARGGNKSQGYRYSGGSVGDEVAWYYENAGNQILDDLSWSIDVAHANANSTHPVGTKSPNELGLYDMSGNVWEWCSDWADRYPNQALSNPQGPLSGSNRVIRGGGWNYGARFAHVSYRDSGSPNYRLNYIGFRLVCSNQ